MRFQPKSKDELNNMTLVPEGIYSFKVIEAQDKTSRAGNEMIELKLSIENEAGHTRVLFDYLLEAMASKLYEFCETTSLSRNYEMGTLRPADCLHKTGHVEIAIDQGKEKPEGGFYPDKNTVKRYILSEKRPAMSEKERVAMLDDDDIPFN